VLDELSITRDAGRRCAQLSGAVPVPRRRCLQAAGCAERRRARPAGAGDPGAGRRQLLLLDEPTNHLDIPAREALQEVLENFQGTILLVSHDRYLIDRLATQIWDLHELTPKPMMRGNSAETRRKAQALEMLEGRIRETETSIQKLSRELQKAGQAQSFDRTHQLSNKLAQAQASLEHMMSEWEKSVES
jgi:ATPase subunit of ABC transporter with duplicated ATPase domains